MFELIWICLNLLFTCFKYKLAPVVGWYNKWIAFEFVINIVFNIVVNVVVVVDSDGTGKIRKSLRVTKGIIATKAR